MGEKVLPLVGGERKNKGYKLHRQGEVFILFNFVLKKIEGWTCLQAEWRDSLERETFIPPCVHSFCGSIKSLLYARHCERCCR